MPEEDPKLIEQINKVLDEDPQARRALAEYFEILLEWRAKAASAVEENRKPNVLEPRTGSSR